MKSPEEYIKSTKLLYGTMLLSQIVFLIVSIWVIKPTREDDYDLEFRLITVLLFVVCLFTSYRTFTKHLKSARRRRGIREKLTLYRKGLNTKWVIFSLFSLFSIISYLMTGDYLFVFATIFSIAFFVLLLRPSIDRTCEDLRLDKNEKRILKTPDAAI